MPVSLCAQAGNGIPPHLFGIWLHSFQRDSDQCRDVLQALGDVGGALQPDGEGWLQVQLPWLGSHVGVQLEEQRTTLLLTPAVLTQRQGLLGRPSSLRRQLGATAELGASCHTVQPPGWWRLLRKLFLQCVLMTHTPDNGSGPTNLESCLCHSFTLSPPHVWMKILPRYPSHFNLVQNAEPNTLVLPLSRVNRWLAFVKKN